MPHFRPTVEVLDARTLPSAATAYMAGSPAVSEIVVTKDLDCASTSCYMAGSPAVSEIVVTKDQDCSSTS